MKMLSTEFVLLLFSLNPTKGIHGQTVVLKEFF